MKFGTQFQEALKKEEFPSPWLESAISYKKLKKCIKRVREELLSLGLDRDTLEALWQHVGTAHAPDAANPAVERLLHYQFTADKGPRFVPKLTVAIDPRDGSPMDAWLSPETKRYLIKVGKHIQRRESRRLSVAPTDGAPAPTTTNSSSNCTSPDRNEIDHQILSNGDTISPTSNEAIDTGEEEIETIEVPLTSDSEFFQLLRQELKALERLQDEEQKDIKCSIESLSKDLQILKSESQKSKYSRAELEKWRKIFQLYIESDIFLSSHESDAGVRPANKAAQQLQAFTKQLTSINNSPSAKPRSKEAHIALDRFLTINTTLLRLLKFQELNRIALSKILKKFDKQTSLHATQSLTPAQYLRNFNTDPTAHVSPHDLARSTAFTISQSLLSLIPQLNDYLCPVCYYITYKPIRLRCNHVFCIRCMIRMQRDQKDECPLCRKAVVLEATEENLDVDLKRFLKREFTREVDEKRRENELEAGREVFGEGYRGTHKCVVM